MNYKKSKNMPIKLIIYIILLSVLYIINFQMNVPAYFLSANAEETNAYDTIDYPCPDDDSVLEKGSKSEEICWLQTALNMITGANLEVDGSFGDKTKSAVIEFQSQYGLTTDGTVDGQTIKKLKEVLSSDTETATNNEKSPEEKEKQQLGKKEYKFTEYWKYYYKYLKKLIFHFTQLKNEIASKSSLNDILLLWGIIEATLLLVCFVTITSEWWKRIYSNGSETFFKKYTVHLNGGCMPVVLFLISNWILLPFIADVCFLNQYWGLDTGGCILKAILYSILRFIIIIAIFFPLDLLLSTKKLPDIICFPMLLLDCIMLININITPIIMMLSIIE